MAEKLVSTLAVRLTDAEYDRVIRQAHASGKTVSEWTRERLDIRVKQPSQMVQAQTY